MGNEEESVNVTVVSEIGRTDVRVLICQTVRVLRLY